MSRDPRARPPWGPRADRPERTGSGAGSRGLTRATSTRACGRRGTS